MLSLPRLRSKEQLTGLCLCLLMTVILVRLAIGLHSYSGAGIPPMYGDFEAQRHWMEITYHLTPTEWYTNSSNNNLNYWGLDYPPLTAYHSWICGAIAHHINPSWVALYESRGIEDYHHKLFMRYTVLVADVLLYFPAIFLFVFVVYRALSLEDKLSVVFLLLTTPSLILIDHGHFQYNSISLGLAVLGVTAAFSQRYILCCVFFSLSLNYKQMELYHAFPFFFFLLGKAFQHERRLLQITKYGVTVILTFLICWLPFLTSITSVQQVLHRLFPFGRGLYEDKVASFWCSLSVLIKLKQILSQRVLVQLSLWTTLVTNLPSAIGLLTNPTPYKFLHSIVISSLSFFLFSFQVHEKSILLAAIPVSLLSVIHPFECTWFTIIATFSMYPLLVKDGLAVPTWFLSIFYFICNYYLLPNLQYNRTEHNTKWISVLFLMSMLSLLPFCLMSHILTPPARWPDLFPVLISGVSCLHFLAFFLWFNYQQFKQPNNNTYQKFSKLVLRKSHKN